MGRSPTTARTALNPPVAGGSRTVVIGATSAGGLTCRPLRAGAGHKLSRTSCNVRRPRVIPCRSDHPGGLRQNRQEASRPQPTPPPDIVGRPLAVPVVAAVFQSDNTAGGQRPSRQRPTGHLTEFGPPTVALALSRMGPSGSADPRSPDPIADPFTVRGVSLRQSPKTTEGRASCRLSPDGSG